MIPDLTTRGPGALGGADGTDQLHAPGLVVPELMASRFDVLPASYDSADEALGACVELLGTEGPDVPDVLSCELPPMQVVARYTMPTKEAPGRAFQPLHMDFGVPLGKVETADVARYTMLFVDRAAEPSGAATRIVRLRDIARQRQWPVPTALAADLRHRKDDADFAEGILARLVEQADGTSELPVKSDPGFLCGMEFDTLASEADFFARHGIALAAVEERIVLAPGQAMIFDNLACAHGRVGQRSLRELHQICLGYPDLGQSAQLDFLSYTLGELTGHRCDSDPE